MSADLQEIIGNVRNGDQRAFGALVEMYRILTNITTDRLRAMKL
jgi:hypothetical protein